MRTKIRINDQWYKPVPWIKDGDCSGCSFDGPGCLNSNVSKFTGLCDDSQEFSGMIFIPNTKEALAEYVAKRLEGNSDDDEMG